MIYAREIRVRGLVQGVGFRPFVWQLANRIGLGGEVFNDAQGVLIRIEGPQNQLQEFSECLKLNTPPLAHIEAIEETTIEVLTVFDGFKIVASKVGAVSTGIVPDAATCADCQSDIFDPDNRRFGYAFTNCTNCGPRLSITRAIPYDRQNTAMSAFQMCPACQSEYDDPSDRRFHAQPNACPQCGPRLRMLDSKGNEVAGNPIISCANAIKSGNIVAIKGLGGFQLAVDAGCAKAVKTLRMRKRRGDKPLACMAQNLEMVTRYVVLNQAEKHILASSQAPIVLAGIKDNSLPVEIAPGQNRLGFMLPNTPLHHLLLHELHGPIVLTSGNVSDEPQIIDNDEAIEKLGGIADFWLLHDRDIVNRLDDSLVQITSVGSQNLRRGRGYAPAPLNLHKGFANCPPTLGIGGDAKNTFCLVKEGQAIVSQHMGDMKYPKVQRDYLANLELYCDMYDFTAENVAFDLHPGYFSTRLAQTISLDHQAKLIGVQHHHAHIATVMGEHGHGPDASSVLAIVLDGLGYGSDDLLWGGEIMLADFYQFKRLAHFPNIPLLGGEKANTQPWRNAYAHLNAVYGPDCLVILQGKYGDLDFIQALNKKPTSILDQMIKRKTNVPLASSAGRLFDAVAAVLGLCFDNIQFEGQAAMQLQVLAEEVLSENEIYPLKPVLPLSWQGLWDGILSDLSQGISPSVISARFHNTLVDLLCNLITKFARELEINTVVLSGGVLQNVLLLNKINKVLTAKGLQVLSPCEFGANDSGIALGQALIGAVSNSLET